MKPIVRPGFYILISMCVASVAWSQGYPVYGPSPQISSGDQSRRQALDNPSKQASSGHIAPKQPVDSVSVDYATIGGKKVTGYLAYPTYNYKHLPGILLFPQWWGLNKDVRAFAERLAGEGYAVLALDPFDGQIAPTLQAAKQLKQQALGNPVALNDNTQQAYRYLKDRLHTLKMAAVGRDFGGDLALRATRTLAGKLQATVIWSGDFTDSTASTQGADPMLILSGGSDSITPAAQAQQFASTQQKQGESVELHIYPGIGHAFANPNGKNYDAATAGDAWRRTKAFLVAHLKR